MTIDNKAVEERIKSLMADEKQEQYRLLRSQAVEELLAEANAPVAAEQVLARRRAEGVQFPADVWPTCPAPSAYLRPTHALRLAKEGVYARTAQFTGAMEEAYLCSPLVVIDSGSESGNPARTAILVDGAWKVVESAPGADAVRRAAVAAGLKLSNAVFAPNAGPNIVVERQGTPVVAYFSMLLDSFRR